MKTFIFGRNPVHEALKANRPINKILVVKEIRHTVIAEIIFMAKRKKIPIEHVPRKRLDAMTEGANHQGVLAFSAAQRYAELDELFKAAKEKKEKPLFLILDRIEDPHNLGAILRTADGAGVHGIIIPKREAAPLTETVAKTSAGAIEYVPVVRVVNLPRVMETLKEKGLWMVGVEGSAKNLYTEADYKVPIAIVIGSEGRGISSLVKKRCDHLVKIPMKGKINSLNASVAAALIMYEAARQRIKS